MSTMKFLRYTCEECGKPYYYQYYRSINTSEHPELEEIVMNGAAFTRVCPYCGKTKFIAHPFVFCAQDKGFIIIMNSYANLMDSRETDKFVEEIVPQYKKDFKKVGVTNYTDLITAITSFENNLDWRVVKMALLYMEYDFIKYCTDNNMPIPTIFNSGLNGEKDENGQLVMFVDIIKNNKTERYYSPLPSIVYKKCFDEYKIRLDLIEPYIFDNNMREHFCNFFEEDFDTQEENKSPYVYVKTTKGKIVICTPIMPMLRNSVLKGKKVKIKMMNNEIEFGTIRRLVDWNFLCISVPKNQFGRIIDAID